MFAYENKFTLRVWGSTFKPALVEEMKRLGIRVLDRTEATVLTMSRPARVWLFDPDLTGLCEFGSMQSIGSGHAMGWRAGMEFTMMEKTVRQNFPQRAEGSRPTVPETITIPGTQPLWWMPEVWKSLTWTATEKN